MVRGPQAAYELAKSFKGNAEKLGLRLKVTWDKDDYCFVFRAEPIVQHVLHKISSECFEFPGAVEYDIHVMLENMQSELHALARSKMDELDVRGRCVSLPREDLDTLHEMLYTAELNLQPRFPHDQEKHERFRALVERLTR